MKGEPMEELIKELDTYEQVIIIYLIVLFSLFIVVQMIL
jgi:hypothetical protein